MIDAVAFDSVHVLFGDDFQGHAQDNASYRHDVMDRIDSFITYIQYKDLSPDWTIDDKMIMLLSAEQRRAQIRYERDARDRIGKGTEYSRNKCAKASSGAKSKNNSQGNV